MSRMPSGSLHSAKGPHARRRGVPTCRISLSMLLSALLCSCAAPGPLPPPRATIELERIPIEYDDHVRDDFAVNADQWRAIEAFFAQAHDGPSEREAIAKAVALLERIAGEQTPIHRDGRKNYGAGPGETDCLDESTNTTTFLQLFRQHGLLRHHRVMHKAFRSPINLDIHWTAVVQDQATGERWVIDTWYNVNGVPPIVQPLNDWLRKAPVPGYYADTAVTPPKAAVTPDD